MFSLLNQPSLRSLGFNVLLSLGSVLLMNGLVFSLGWEMTTAQSEPWFEPPGYVVGLIWTGLFGLMAVARWLMNFSSTTSALNARLSITLLIGFCWLYPLYTLALNSLINSLIGNLATIALASFALMQVWTISRVASVLITLVIVWVVIATAVVCSELGWV